MVRTGGYITYFFFSPTLFHFTGPSLTLDKTREDIRWTFLHPSSEDALFLQPFHSQPNHEGVLFYGDGFI